MTQSSFELSDARHGTSSELGPRPLWLTFDCYGTLIQWDEGLTAAAERIVMRHGITGVSAAEPRRVV